MSFFGKNIRKIRSIKKISQSEFASIFDLSRASVGSYEEGRAEPKIEIINKVAKYFSITIDELINKELTVNELYHFDVGNEPAFKNASIKNISVRRIPFLYSNKLSSINNKEGLTSETYIEIPLESNLTNCIAIHINNNDFACTPHNIQNQSTVTINLQQELPSNASSYYLIKTSNAIFISKLNILANNQFHIQDALNDFTIISADDIVFCYPVVQYMGGLPCEDPNSRIEKLEQQLNQIISKFIQ
ncbi:helix-turn-helix domain-containing protein [Carboxylicivirga linearis]|uniref:Helix-turn-helix transcriptional regulator n=1 Tax=Carboxylicivirga linearis TaxID=1628157 RepID=A0ABS5JTI5_9BACT|nr:helix-turn-helix transcriptional regulator [Carboxylicivirga linearis]MBS2097676.1 helix-turn-helix transcriptional regulator [Carboxylicivirga linearis]